jgi:hypothetical protein
MWSVLPKTHIVIQPIWGYSHCHHRSCYDRWIIVTAIFHKGEYGKIEKKRFLQIIPDTPPVVRAMVAAVGESSHGL